MQHNKENFLDFKNLLAIGFLLLSWFAWSFYMKKKYPPASKAPLVETLQKEKIIEEEKKAKPQSLKVSKEKTVEFKGKNIEILFSSHGLGLKKVSLKNFFNKEKKPIVFSPEKPLFSSYLFKSLDRPIPFKIKKEGNHVYGLFSSPEGSIKTSIEIIDEEYVILNVRTEVELKPKQNKGLSLSFSHIIPKTKDRGLLNLFFLYGQDLLKAFVSYGKGETERFQEEDFEEKKELKLLNLVALGGKYFGKAFINQAPLLPSVSLMQKSGVAFAHVDYEFLSSKKQEIKYQIFVGPKSLKGFQKLNTGLQQWLDFGFFGWLARPLLFFLNWLYSWCANWGLAIILLTFFVRLALFPINMKSYKSMKIMQKIQPQIKELKEVYKKDPKKMNLEVLALMKKSKANPLGGCLPMFIQFPVFFALYRVLGESIELYQSPFIFWIQDLSLKDSYYVLPVLAGLTLFFQQRITPMNLPKEQARLLTAMPLLFSVFMLGLPSGLTLYIFVSGLFGLAQQFFFVKLGSNYFKGGEDVKVV